MEWLIFSPPPKVSGPGGWTTSVGKLGSSFDSNSTDFVARNPAVWRPSSRITDSRGKTNLFFAGSQRAQLAACSQGLTAREWEGILGDAAPKSRPLRTVMSQRCRKIKYYTS